MPHQLRLGLRAAHDLLELRHERLRGPLVTELQIDDDLIRLGEAAAHSLGLHPLLGTEPLVLVEVRLPGVEVLDGVLDVDGGHCLLLGSVEDQPAAKDTRSPIPDPGDFRRLMLSRWLPRANWPTGPRPCVAGRCQPRPCARSWSRWCAGPSRSADTTSRSQIQCLAWPPRRWPTCPACPGPSCPR